MALPSSPATVADPFGARSACRHRWQRTVLGGRFHFASDSEALLRLVQVAYDGLPAHALPGAADFHVELRLLPARAERGPVPPVRQQAGAGWLCGVMDECNYVVIDPRARRALVSASQDMLDHPYHLRYELIEFAVFTLAARGMGLVPLHGACVGHGGRGVLLLGDSGAGKSTLALHSLLQGLDFLAEDAVFVQPHGLLATGVPNFLHLRPEALPRVPDGAVRAWLEHSPRIHRRSGVEKFEADLRLGGGRLAGQPLQLIGAVMVTNEAAGGAEPLALLEPGEAATWLAANQPYAAGQPGWQAFVQALLPRGVYRLRRGSDPLASVERLWRLLGRHTAGATNRAAPLSGAQGDPTFPQAACTQGR